MLLRIKRSLTLFWSHGRYVSNILVGATCCWACTDCIQRAGYALRSLPLSVGYLFFLTEFLASSQDINLPNPHLLIRRLVPP